jgi:hypothetical protein
MPIGLLFWMIYLLWVILGFVWNWPNSNEPRAWYPLGGNVILLILLFLLGWAEFGFVIKG